MMFPSFPCRVQLYAGVLTVVVKTSEGVVSLSKVK